MGYILIISNVPPVSEVVDSVLFSCMNQLGVGGGGEMVYILIISIVPPVSEVDSVLFSCVSSILIFSSSLW